MILVFKFWADWFDFTNFDCGIIYHNRSSWRTDTAAFAAALSLSYSYCLSEARRNYLQTMNQLTQPCLSQRLHHIVTSVKIYRPVLLSGLQTVLLQTANMTNELNAAPEDIRVGHLNICRLRNKRKAWPVDGGKIEVALCPLRW